MNQSRKIFIALILFSLVLLWLGQKIGDRQGLLIAFLLAFGINSFIYYFSDLRVLSLFKGKEIEGNDAWGLQKHLGELCQKARLPKPKVYLCNLPCPTAITIGKSWAKSYIILSQALLDNFEKEDLKAILALEIAKIKRLDTLGLGMVSIITSIVLSISHALDKVFCFHWLIKSETKRYQPFTWFFLSLLRVLFYFILNPKMYLEADRFAATIFPDTKRLAKVIWRLDSYASSCRMDIPLDTAHLFIVNPLPNHFLLNHLSYQPKFDIRIQRLVGHFPI